MKINRRFKHDAIKTLSLIDGSGEILNSAITNKRSYSLNVKKWSAGNYFIRIEDDKKNTTMNFIKE